MEAAGTGAGGGVRNGSPITTVYVGGVTLVWACT